MQTFFLTNKQSNLLEENPITRCEKVTDQQQSSLQYTYHQYILKC